MKITDLTPEYIGFAGKGDMWSNNLHIAKRGFDPSTLCGKPMLSHNYAPGPFGGITRDEIGCTHCLDEYMQAMGKPDDPGLRAVTMELFPNEIKILMLLIEQFQDDYEPNRDDTVRIQGEVVTADEVVQLHSKLSHAAEDNISGD